MIEAFAMTGPSFNFDLKCGVLSVKFKWVHLLRSISDDLSRHLSSTIPHWHTLPPAKGPTFQGRSTMPWPCSLRGINLLVCCLATHPHTTQSSLISTFVIYVHRPITRKGGIQAVWLKPPGQQTALKLAWISAIFCDSMSSLAHW